MYKTFDRPFTSLEPIKEAKTASHFNLNAGHRSKTFYGESTVMAEHGHKSIDRSDIENRKTNAFK